VFRGGWLDTTLGSPERGAATLSFGQRQDAEFVSAIPQSFVQGHAPCLRLSHALRARRRGGVGVNGCAERTTQSCWLRPGDVMLTGGSSGV
jgi:hypothetical protein